MTRQQWLILIALASAVLVLYCLGGILVVQMLTDQSAQLAGLESTLEPTAPRDGATSALPTAAPRTQTPSTPRSTVPRASPTAPPTATWVLQPPPVASTPGTPQPSTSPAPLAGASTPGTPQPSTPPAPLAGASAPLAAAWDKSQTATTFRIALEMAASGKLGLPGVTTNQSFPLMNVSGAVNGKDSHLVIKGLVAMFLSGDANKPIEIMTVGGKTYIHGPVPMLGANEDKWYVSTPASASSLSQSSDFTQFLGDHPALGGFKKSGSETLDGRRCDVYSGDKTATYNLFAGLNLQGTLDKETLAALESAESKFWICDDGYFHQLWMKMDVHNKNQPSEKGTLELKLHLYDYNANIKLTPPATAAPLPMPSFNLATPTRLK